MEGQTIGRAPCPSCGKEIDYRESKKKQAYCSCAFCQTQHFARGEAGDKLMRDRIANYVRPTNGKAHPAVAAATKKPGRPTRTAAVVRPPTPPPGDTHGNTEKTHNAGLLIS